MSVVGVDHAHCDPRVQAAMKGGKRTAIRAVYIALCRRHNAKRGDALVWPQLKALCDETGLPERTVKRALKWLADDGFIENLPERRDGARLRRLLLLEQATSGEQATSEQATSDTRTGHIAHANRPHRYACKEPEGTGRESEEQQRARARSRLNGSPRSDDVDPSPSALHQDAAGKRGESGMGSIDDATRVRGLIQAVAKDRTPTTAEVRRLIGNYPTVPVVNETAEVVRKYIRQGERIEKPLAFLAAVFDRYGQGELFRQSSNGSTMRAVGGAIGDFPMSERERRMAEKRERMERGAAAVARLMEREAGR
jgi:hypothetical protein